MKAQKLIVLAVSAVCAVALVLAPSAASAASGGASGPRASMATVKTCAPGQSAQGNYCQCPPGQSAGAGNYCEATKCPAGETLEGNYCEPIKCPAGEVLVGNHCQPKGGGPPPSECTANAPQTAAAAGQAALTAVTSAGISGLAKTGRVSFNFASQTCGGYRFLLRVQDPRSKKRRTVTIGYTTVVNFLSTIAQGETKTVNVKIRPVGLSILKYAQARKLSLRALVITHVRASNSNTSVQVLDGILLK